MRYRSRWHARVIYFFRNARTLSCMEALYLGSFALFPWLVISRDLIPNFRCVLFALNGAWLSSTTTCSFCWACFSLELSLCTIVDFVRCLKIHTTHIRMRLLSRPPMGRSQWTPSLGSYHEMWRLTKWSRWWYVARIFMNITIISHKYIYVGRRRQSIYTTTPLGSIQEDPGSSQKAPCILTNGWIFENCKFHSLLKSMRGGQSLLQAYYTLGYQ